MNIKILTVLQPARTFFLKCWRKPAAGEILEPKIQRTSDIRRFIKYIFVGFLNTGIYYGIYYTLLKCGFFYIVCVTAGTVAGIINSYFWNKRFTFRSKKKSVGEVLKFVTVYIVQYFFNIFFIHICLNFTGISAEQAGLLASGVGMFISYFGHKLWSFRS